MEVLGTGRAIVIAFGRFNPPTSGHALLIKEAQKQGAQLHAPVIVYVSKTQDRQRNPLTPEQKVNYLHEMFPRVDFRIADADPPTFIGEAKKLSQTYSHLIMVAGSDRVPEFQRLLDKYNGTEFQFDSVKVVSAGQRDPDSDGASGMSASKMREFAQRGNIQSFISGVKPYLSDVEAEHMYNDVRVGMGLSEQVTLSRSYSSWQEDIVTDSQLDALNNMMFPAQKSVTGKFDAWLKREQVEFSLARRHGKSIGEQGTAKGRNIWFFTNKPEGGVNYQNPEEFFQHTGRFCDARDAATIWAREHGHKTVYVM